MSAASENPEGQRPKRRFAIGAGIWGAIIVAATAYLRSRPRVRTFAIVVGCLGIAANIVLSFLNLTGGAVTLFFVSGAILLSALFASDEFEITLPASEETAERLAAQARVEATPEPSAKETLDLNLKRLSEYYAINQAQAKTTFRWAVFFMILGSLTVLAGIWIFYLRDPPRLTLAALTSAGGILTDVIAATFLYVNTQTQKRSLIYYERLVKTEQIMLSIRLAESHADPKERAVQVNRIIDMLIRAAAEPGVLGLDDVPPPKRKPRK